MTDLFDRDKLVSQRETSSWWLREVITQSNRLHIRKRPSSWRNPGLMLHSTRRQLETVKGISEAKAAKLQNEGIANLPRHCNGTDSA
jgi:hypothetical protein